MSPTASRFKFCFTVDTEPDDLWASNRVLSFDHFDRLASFHRRVVEHGGRPTYLTTSEVAESPQARRAVDSCLSFGQCELGAHFHTWTRKWPFQIPSFPSAVHAMAHCLGEQTERAMLHFTCKVLDATFHVQPHSYRGGRWSLGTHTAASLASCGIGVDSSVLPGVSFSNFRSPLIDGADYRKANPCPHWLKNSEPRVLEIPLGAAWWPACVPQTPFCLLKPAQRILNFVRVPSVGHHWLRPTYYSPRTLRGVMRSLKRRNIPIWVCMIHSSELRPCSPLPSEDRVNRFIDRCMQTITLAAEMGAVPATLSEAALAWTEHSDPLPAVKQH
jgi:hypothetical protein